MNRLYNLVGFLLLFSSAFGQVVDTTHSINIYQEALSIDQKLSITAEGGLMTSFLNKTLIQENYWSDEIIQNQVDNLADFNRFGVVGDFKASYHTGTGLFYTGGYTTMIGGAAQKQIAQIILEGNQSQPIIELSENNSIEQLGYANIAIGKESYDSAKKMRIHYGVGLYARQNYFKTIANSGTFSLDSAGENIAVTDADVRITQDMANPFNTLGLGINFGFTQLYKQSLILFSVENMGVFFGTQTRTAQLYSNFVFDGFNLSSQINRAGAVVVEDSINNGYFDSDTSSKTQLLPMKFRFGLTRDLGNHNSIITELNYVYFTGYLPLLQAQYQQQFNGKRATWNVGARIGGFSNYAIMFGAKLPFKNHMVTLQVAGLESLASDNLPVNWYGNLGLQFKL